MSSREHAPLSYTPAQRTFALLVGSAIKEKRYETFFGDAFRAYKQRVPFWFPSRRTLMTDGDRPLPASSVDTQVVIAGAGPVGLMLANLLGIQKIKVLVVERQRTVDQASMAIGITPPSLQILHTLGLDTVFRKAGLAIETARVFEHGTMLGALSFKRLPSAYRFILSLPQAKTLSLLRQNLKSLPSVTLVTGTAVAQHANMAGHVRVSLRDEASGEGRDVTARLLVGCDGHDSAVRRQAAITSRSRDYASHFLMADFPDTTAFGGEAHLYFGPDGSVESFPLPDGQRRWIVLQNRAWDPAVGIAGEVARCVAARTGYALDAIDARFASQFTPRRARATRFHRGRVVLCGDAAHVMSPIGGQGMNTGFGDAAHLARTIATILRAPATAAVELRRYERSRQRACRIAANRAERGMWLGTRAGTGLSRVRGLLISKVLFRAAMRERLAPYFAMLTIPQDACVSAPLVPLGDA